MMKEKKEKKNTKNLAKDIYVISTLNAPATKNRRCHLSVKGVIPRERKFKREIENTLQKIFFSLFYKYF